jgi:hypothetical protein
VPVQVGVAGVPVSEFRRRNVSDSVLDLQLANLQVALNRSPVPERSVHLMGQVLVQEPSSGSIVLPNSVVQLGVMVPDPFPFSPAAVPAARKALRDAVRNQQSFSKLSSENKAALERLLN